MPKCDAACQKIIIDTGGRLARVARFYSEAADAFNNAFQRAIDNGRDFGDESDELHALSELDCHRAKQMVEWAEELHERTVRLAGGEYRGGFEVDGIAGIRKKD